MKQKILIALASACLMVTVGCKKALPPTAITTTSKAVSNFPYQPFNWENSSVMMPSLPAGPLNPSLPWSGGSGAYLDPGIITDYKSADGWVLVYNTFNPQYYTASAVQGGLYFALYNKYRSLLRFYLYVPGGQFGGGSYIQHGLALYGSTSSNILDHEGTDLIDASTNNPYFTKTNNVGVAQQGGWYAMQYELAYDPNIGTDPFPDKGITWNSRTVTTDTILLNGTLAGTITGDVSQQSGGVLGTVLNGALGIVEGYGIATQSGNSNKVVTNLVSAAANAISGNIFGFFSSVVSLIGGNSNNSAVDLKLNSQLTANGTIQTPNALAPNFLPFPGQPIDQGNPTYPPLYTTPLGLFSLPTRPTVTLTYFTQPDRNGNYNVQFAVGHTAGGLGINELFNAIQWNPKIVNINTSSAFLDDTQGDNINEPSTGNAIVYNFNVLVELVDPFLPGEIKTNYMPVGSNVAQNPTYIGNHMVLEQPTSNGKIDGTPENFMIQYPTTDFQPPYPFASQVAVKVAFQIQDGSGPLVTVVKTFLANTQYVIDNTTIPQ